MTALRLEDVAPSERPAAASALTAREKANLRWGTFQKTPDAQPLPTRPLAMPLPCARATKGSRVRIREGRGFPQQSEDEPRGRAGPIIRVEGVDGNTLYYIIDGEGHRVAKLVNAQLQKQYVWSSSLRIEAELDGTGRLTSRFIYGSKVNVPELVVKPSEDGDKFYRIITDQLGSPVYVVNIHDSDDVLLEASYDEWGQVTQYTSSTGQWPLPFAFAGGLFDEDTGLVRFGARDYDPRVGRWTAKDPILFDGGQANLYVYVGNDPVGSVDPEGQSKFDRWYGAPKRLKKWFHRQHKDTHGPDADKKGVKDACDEWNREGQPGPDNKRGRTRKKQTPPDEDPWDDLDIIIPFPDLPSPCDYSGGLFPDLCGGSST